ncbi:aldo/keto reductase [Pseudoxanthomonas sp. SE1]|uniref:aldo/keto reductase n=1 Tax=Pseudoxanthomonas sp. SE1 TaxID=1664560 RepID=UPI00240D518B|nr:aldo/keto reductase [Pseudoxanthomonas sp. SE1]WFC42682.1 aldo/keto reductase [Pseudoxanthomonas sp. SE1]
MHYRRLGNSGLQVSALSFGAWLTFGQQVGREQARELIALAWDQGVNFFDNAEVYGHGEAERVMGQVLRDLDLPRDGFCVSSKVCFGAVENPRPTQRGLSRKHVVEGCHAALQRLQVDYLDLYYCHRPDPDTPVEETVWVMDTLVRQGKVLYWGTSEWPAARIREAASIARRHHLHGPTMEQPQYNLLHRQRVELEYAPLYAELGLGTTTWSPLASGLLTGKYDAGVDADTRLGQPGHEELQRMVFGAAGARRRERARRYAQVAVELGEKPAPLAIAWCLRNPHVSSVILGASRPEQLRENLTALDLAARYDDAVWARLTAAAD